MTLQEVQKIKPTIIGCIWYSFATGEDKAIHVSEFSGSLSMAEDKRGPATDLNPIPIPFSIGRISKDRLKVVDVLMTGTAN